MAAIFFWLTLRFFLTVMCISVPQCCILILVLIQSKSQSRCHITPFELMMQISKKNPSRQTLMVQVIFLFFFVDHIELDLCIQFQVNWTWNMVWGAWPFRNVFFFFLTATPPGQLGSFWTMWVAAAQSQLSSTPLGFEPFEWCPGRKPSCSLLMQELFSPTPVWLNSHTGPHYKPSKPS